jgi:cation transport ATPase
MGREVPILPGDRQAVAEAVANQVGILRVFAEVFPELKDQLVIEL